MGIEHFVVSAEIRAALNLYLYTFAYPISMFKNMFTEASMVDQNNITINCTIL